MNCVERDEGGSEGSMVNGLDVKGNGKRKGMEMRDVGRGIRDLRVCCTKSV